MVDINEEIRNGDFSSFDRLPESQQIEIVKSWDDATQLKYLTREPVMSQEEFFAELDRIADGTFKSNESQG